MVVSFPSRQNKTEALMSVTNANQPIFSPAIGLGACLVVRHCQPGIAVCRVVCPYRAPLALREIIPPTPPVRGALPSSFAAQLLLGHRLCPSCSSIRPPTYLSPATKEGGGKYNAISVSQEPVVPNRKKAGLYDAGISRRYELSYRKLPQRLLDGWKTVQSPATKRPGFIVARGSKRCL